jgi:hypothetical protein
MKNQDSDGVSQVRSVVVAGAALFSVLVGAGLGICAAMGVCVAIWGGGVLETALGSTPDRSHPAFWAFLMIMFPAMLLGIAGTMFSCYLPLCARWPRACLPKLGLGLPVLRVLHRYCAELEEVCAGEIERFTPLAGRD